MPLFMCASCGCFDNTALSGYWTQEFAYFQEHKSLNGFKPQCSLHDPSIGKWHGQWPRQLATDFQYDKGGKFIWRPSEQDRVKHLGPFTDVVLPEGASV